MAPEELAVALAVAVRRAGADVPVSSVATFLDALDVVGVERRDGVYWAGRATLVRRHEDVPAYDVAFAALFDGVRLPVDVTRMVVEVAAPSAPTTDDDQPSDDAPQEDDETDDAGDERRLLAITASPVEVLRHKDFAACTTDELAELHRLLARIRLQPPTRRSRRRHAARDDRHRHGRPIHLRATVRRSIAAGGDAVVPVDAVRDVRPRRLILLCDVSGSMAPYSRALLRFLHAAVAGGTRVEAFALGTRLTRLTRQLSAKDPDAALTAASRAVTDWSGGTRLGETLRTFNDGWGVRGLARGAVVVVLSDGWDRGDPDVLAGELARLRRVAHELVWVNPLKASPGYEPLARGMAAALPHVDRFVEGHSLASIEDLAAALAALGGRGVRR